MPLLHRLPERQFAYFGSLGVSIFFVISGFLITGLLIGEKEKRGTVSLKNFYIRRVLRIFPAYYVYLFAIFVLAATGFIALTPRDLLWSGLYLRDYSAQATAWTNHTWSLAVEEQFYLLWPLLVLLLDKRRLIVLCLIVIAVSPVVRILTYESAPGLRDLITVMFHTRADTLLFGCLLALTRFDTSMIRVKELFVRYNGPLLAALGLFVLSPLVYSRFHDGYLLTLGYTFDNACIALLLIWTVDHRGVLAGRILNWTPIAAIGTLSYSLYLWHVIFISPLRGTLVPFPVNVVLTFVIAWCSFRFIEMPFNGLRQRFGSVSVSSEPLPIPTVVPIKVEG